MIEAIKLQEAIEFAVHAHSGQVRKGNGRPYILHPLSVMNRVYAIKKSENIHLLGAAAVLHDTVEDCGIKINEIADKFGYHVAALVSELTLDKSRYELLGKKEYLAEEMMRMSSYALVIKLCDRLDNVCDMKTMHKPFIDKYTEETKYLLEKIKTRKLTTTHLLLISDIETELLKYESSAEVGTPYSSDTSGVGNTSISSII